MKDIFNEGRNETEQEINNTRDEYVNKVIKIGIWAFVPFLLLLTIGPSLLGGDVALACFAGYMQLLIIVFVVSLMCRRYRMRQGLVPVNGRVCSFKKVEIYYYAVVEFEFGGKTYQTEEDGSDFHYTAPEIGTIKKVYINPANPDGVKLVGGVQVGYFVLVILGTSLFLDTIIFLLLFVKF